MTTIVQSLFPDTSNDASLTWWLNKTFNLGDFIEYVNSPSEHYDSNNQVAINETGYYEHLQLGVHEVGEKHQHYPINFYYYLGFPFKVSTGYGRCYTFYPDWPMRANDYYTFQLIMDNHNELNFFFHERHVTFELSVITYWYKSFPSTYVGTTRSA